ncbi:metalloregulator ArsR/SmtB family transcription factor [uncultured Ilyobacter sp.]|uniref:ArsR/SmtB family transcription factor n=1 Tax=uncultured Ilyobacter sp. TaxID=544433 RepID=UPI0029F4826D|nr:metalloregulator ArsR/SmtB family transcription factor [uncultured Ilyobacter sp.]
MDIIEILKTLADENRMRILNILYRKNKLCVCDIEQTLGLTQSNVSRHISRLRKEKLIIGEKKAQWVYYYINEKLLEDYPFIKEILENELKEGIFTEDLEKISIGSISCE